MNGAKILRYSTLAASRLLWRPIYRRLVPRLMPGGYSGPPRHILIQLTYTCNLRCWFCNQWGSTGLYKALPGAELRQVLPLSTLQDVVDDLPFLCESVMLWGGETLQYPDLVPLVRHVKQAGKGCSIITNGTLLPKLARGLVEAGLDTIYVSLDATEETHDRFRGAQGTYRAVVEGIGVLREERSSRKNRRPKIHVGCTLLPSAAEELPALVREVRAAGADSIILCKVSYATERLGQAHDQVFQELFQITPTSWKGFVRPEGMDGAAKMKAAVEQLRADPEYRDFIVWENGRWRPEDFSRYYSNPTYTGPADRACRFPWDSVCIYPNGDMSPCPDFPDYVVGNVTRESFSQIWNGASFRQFRKVLAERGRFPICSICCHLYDE